MKILYDHQIFSLQKRGGISRYYSELISGLGHFPNIQIKVGIKVTQNEYIKKIESLKNIINLNKINLRGIHKFITYINKNYLIGELQKKDYDIFHPTLYDPYFLDYIAKKPFVLTVYDCTHERLPNYFSYKSKSYLKNKELLINKANKIIAISNTTKQDLIELYGVDENKIEVIYLGYKKNKVSHQKKLTLNLPSNYILFVGMRHGYKNFETFIMAISTLLKERNKLKLVCAGGGQFTAKEKAIIKDLGISNKVMQFDFADDELDNVYRRATIFIYPSLYEGFGLPLIEAFYNDCPVACSKIDTFIEVAGNAALYFNPTDQKDMKKVLINVLDNENLRSKLVNESRLVRTKYTWPNTVERTMSLYKNLLRED